MLIEAWPEIVDELLPIARLVVTAVASIHILLFKSNSRSVVAWIALVMIFPLLGASLYWLLGINRHSSSSVYVPASSGESENTGVSEKNSLAKDCSAIEVVGQRVTQKSILAGNQIELLQDGEQAFPLMLKAIAEAKHEVLLTTYIFERDEVGRDFVSAMLEAKNRGVQVCVLLDDVGRRHSLPTILPMLRKAGIDTRSFNPLRLFPPNLGINLRNHRKMVVVDQVVSFAGGMNIGARHLTGRLSKEQARDICFKFEGPMVLAMRELFHHDWCQSGGANLDMPPAAQQPGHGQSRCRLIADGPDDELNRLTLTIIGVLSSAQRRVVVITPYFLPNARIVGALQAAALRGVDVNIVIPSRCNWPVVRWAMNHRIQQLLEVGVKLTEQPPPFVHSKCLLVDDAYALVGSANIDERSLRLNFELGVEIFDPRFCQELGRYAETCLRDAIEVEADRIEKRGSFARFRDALASLFEPYL